MLSGALARAALSTPASGQYITDSSTEMETAIKSDSLTAYKFTIEQLLMNKGNMKWTEAQKFLHVSLQDKTQ